MQKPKELTDRLSLLGPTTGPKLDNRPTLGDTRSKEAATFTAVRLATKGRQGAYHKNILGFIC
jgi:hypothetical protein